MCSSLVFWKQCCLPFAKSWGQQNIVGLLVLASPLVGGRPSRAEIDDVFTMLAVAVWELLGLLIAFALLKSPMGIVKSKWEW